MSTNYKLNILRQAHMDSLSNSLAHIYRRCNANRRVTLTNFRDEFAKIVLPFINFLELEAFVKKQQFSAGFSPKYSGAYVLLNYVRELSVLFGRSIQDISCELDIALFDSKKYDAYFVHYGSEVISSGKLSKLHSYIEKNTSKNINRYGTFYLVVATNEDDAIATAKLRGMQPLNPLNMMSFSFDEYFNEESYSPMVGTVLNNGGCVFQSAYPMELVLKFGGTRRLLYKNIIKSLGSEKFEACAFFGEVTTLMKIGDEYHRFPEFLAFCDIENSEIVDYEAMLRLSKNADGTHPMEKIVNKIKSSKTYRLVHLGHENLISGIDNHNEIAIPLSRAESAGIPDTLLRRLIESVYEVGGVFQES